MGHGVHKSIWTLSGLYFIHLFLQKSLTESLAHSRFSFAFLNVIPESHNEKHGELSPEAPQKQKQKPSDNNRNLSLVHMILGACNSFNGRQWLSFCI